MRRRTKVIIASVVVVGLLLSGVWMYYTGILARILFTLLMLSIPPTPKESIPQWPTPPENATIPKPTPEPPQAGAALNETRIAVEHIELIKVADRLMTLTNINIKPEITVFEMGGRYHLRFEYGYKKGWYVDSENVAIGYYKERMAFVAAFPPNKTGVFSIDRKPDSQLRTVTDTLRLRISFITSIPRYVVYVNMASPRNPAGGASPSIFAVISSIYADASEARAGGAFLGKNFFIYPYADEWVVYDFNYRDLWPGPENITGWPLDPDEGITVIFSADKVGEKVPYSDAYFAAVGVDTTLYEPSALCKITIKNNFTEPFVGLRVRAKSDWVCIYLSKPLNPGESVNATVSFLEEFEAGETYNITVEAIYLHMLTESIGEYRSIVKTVRVPCVSGS